MIPGPTGRSSPQFAAVRQESRMNRLGLAKIPGKQPPVNRR